MHLVRRALADALFFLLPVDCAGCGAPDETLCPACSAALDVPPLLARAAGLPVTSAGAYEGVLARAVRALKEEGRTGLARPFGARLRALADDGDLVGVTVVPIPTSSAALRRRGYRVPELLARRAGWRPVPLLRATRPTADQRGLGRLERASNVAGSLAVRGAAEGRRILLVDDVVTTGATLAEAARALGAAGAHVVGAVTVAATPRLGRP